MLCFRSPHQKRSSPRRGMQGTGTRHPVQGVGVLIFIHHHGGIVRRMRPAQRGGVFVRVTEQTEASMFKVAELQQLRSALGPRTGIEIRTAANRARRRGLRPCGLPQLTAGDQLWRSAVSRAAPSSARVWMTLCSLPSRFFLSLSGRAALHTQRHIGGQIVKRGPFPATASCSTSCPAGRQPCPAVPVHRHIFSSTAFFAFSRAEGVFFSGIGQLLALVARQSASAARNSSPAVRALRAASASSRSCQQVAAAIFLLPRSQKFVQLFVVIGQGAQEIVDMQDRLRPP